MTGKAGLTLIGLVIIFLIINAFIGSMITGSDNGSAMIRNLLRLAVAAGIIVSALMIARGGKGHAAKAKAGHGHAKGR